MDIALEFLISRPGWRLRFGIDTDYFTWAPCEIESGRMSPAEHFDAPAQAYWLWGWLGFVVYYTRARAWY
jgi:hypothetical protein